MQGVGGRGLVGAGVVDVQDKVDPGAPGLVEGGGEVRDGGGGWRGRGKWGWAGRIRWDGGWGEARAAQGVHTAAPKHVAHAAFHARRVSRRSKLCPEVLTTSSVRSYTSCQYLTSVVI
jgi:hypothetical protein